MANGVCAAWAVRLYCTSMYLNLIYRKGHSADSRLQTACRTNYHGNFDVRAGVRTYYGGIPDYIQVGEHQFVETALVYHWVDLMLTSW